MKEVLGGCSNMTATVTIACGDCSARDAYIEDVDFSTDLLGVSSRADHYFESLGWMFLDDSEWVCRKHVPASERRAA